MQLVEQHHIKPNSIYYKDLESLCGLSKNLYNAGLYAVRQHYFDTKKYLPFHKVAKKFASDNNIDFRALPAKVAQQTLKQVEQNFKSFFGSLKAKSTKKVSIPKYLPKNGRYAVIYTNQAISKRELAKGFVKLSGTSIKIKSDKKNIQQVRVIPKNQLIIVEIVYNTTERTILPDNGRYASIDLGLSNLATLGSNVGKQFIVNGNPLKAINQFYNKRKAELQSLLTGTRKTSKRIQLLTNKRNNRIKDYLHKASRYIVNYLVSNNINTLVVGYNKNWKQSINIGKRNNQNFVGIPFYQFVNMLEYKCKLAGITLIKQEESYTSKCSFLDNEKPQKQEKYKGRRVTRGLFKSYKGLINADLNGSLNILKKAIPNAFSESYGIAVCSKPLEKISL